VGVAEPIQLDMFHVFCPSEKCKTKIAVPVFPSNNSGSGMLHDKIVTCPKCGKEFTAQIPDRPL
jgi:hypothetical protein